MPMTSKSVPKQLAADVIAPGMPPSLKLSSSTFELDAPLPRNATEDAERSLAPSLSWSEPPRETKSLLLVVQDPDAPREEPFVHWLIYDIPPTADSVGRALTIGARPGLNDRKVVGYYGAAPPSGDGAHHYHFQLFALDKKLGLDAGLPFSDVAREARQHCLAWGETRAIYARP